MTYTADRKRKADQELLKARQRFKDDTARAEGDWGDVVTENESLASGLQFHDDHQDSHHGQHDYVLWAHHDGIEPHSGVSTDYHPKVNKAVGSVEYSEFRGKPHIKMIKTHSKYGRRRVASGLINHLAKKYGGYHKLQWGMLTDDGSKLKKAMDKNYKKNVNETFPAGFDSEDDYKNWKTDVDAEHNALAKAQAERRQKGKPCEICGGLRHEGSEHHPVGTKVRYVNAFSSNHNKLGTVVEPPGTPQKHGRPAERYKLKMDDGHTIWADHHDLTPHKRNKAPRAVKEDVQVLSVPSLLKSVLSEAVAFSEGLDIDKCSVCGKAGHPAAAHQAKALSPEAKTSRTSKPVYTKEDRHHAPGVNGDWGFVTKDGQIKSGMNLPGVKTHSSLARKLKLGKDDHQAVERGHVRYYVMHPTHDSHCSVQSPDSLSVELAHKHASSLYPHVRKLVGQSGIKPRNVLLDVNHTDTKDKWGDSHHDSLTHQEFHDKYGPKY